MAEQEITTLYRVENPNIPVDSRLESGGTSHPELRGQWFSDSLDKALNYLPKAVRYKPEGQGARPFIGVDGAVVRMAQIPTSELEQYRAANHPIVRESQMDIEPTEDFIVPSELVVDALPIDDLVGESRMRINRYDEQASVATRVRGAVALRLAGIKAGDVQVEAHKTRENLTQDFAKFKPLVDDLKVRLENHEDSRNDEAYLGGGGNSRAFTLAWGGKEYVAIVPATREAWKPNAAVEARVQPLLAVQGVPHLEQIAAVSDEYGVTISERMPGMTLDSEMPLAAISSISQEQIDTLVDTILIGSERGIVFDPKLSNFLYDPTEGFGIIDFQSPDTYGVTARDAARQVSDIVTKINTMATGKSLPTTFEDFTYKRDGAIIRLGFLRKMRTAVSSKLSGDGLATVLDRVDERIRDIENGMPQLSDEEYINTTIQANLDEIHKQSELTRKGLGGWGTL